jgi:adenylate kinase
MIILILGLQGCGKGTQAALLAKKFKLHYFESGALFRNLAKTHPEIDKIIHKQGGLVKDDLTFSYVKKFLEARKLKDDLIFDGYPRSIRQFNLLKRWLARKNKKIDLAIFLRISRAESIKRLSARRKDPKTGKIYNLITNPPGPKVDKASLIQRKDDQPEVIKQRIRLYEKTTLPLIKLLQKRGILVEINGERPIAAIAKDLEQIIKNLG